MSLNRKWLVAPALLAVIAGAVWMAWRDHAASGSSLLLHGNVDIREVELAFNASGRVEKVLVHEGETVKKGQLLAQLDTVRLQLALRQARALADAQRSQVAKLRAGSRPEEIAQAAAVRDAARATALEARQLYRRQLELVAQHFIPQQQVDSAKNALDAADEGLKAAEQAHRLAVLGPRKEDLAAAEASLAAQNAAVAGLERDIWEGDLRAPENGVIENRVLEPGDMASPQKTVFTVALTDPVWARVYLPEQALGRVPAGARAVITADSYPGREYAAWVGYVSPTAEFTPKSVETQDLRTSLVYQARVYACDARGELRQGMPVTVRIRYDQTASGERPCASSP
jgi:HlyD family secretion protein